VLDGTIQTLSTQNAPDKGPVRGLLFVPSLNPQDPCNNATASLVPSNSTRHSHVAPLNFPNIGLAPWVSIDCTQSFLNASQQQGVEALIFFLPSTNDSKPPAPEDSIWNLGDDGAWKSQNNYPVYAIPGPAGETLMQQLSWYSDNATLVGFDTDSNLNESSVLTQDQHGIVRLFALIDYGKTTHSSQGVLICGIRSADFALPLLQRRIIETCPVSGGSSSQFWEWYWFSVSSSFYVTNSCRRDAD
jgi:hypothetical protein